MKKIAFLVLTCFLLVCCPVDNDIPQTPTTTSADPDKGKSLDKSGYIDESVSIGDNFYGYCVGKYIKDNASGVNDPGKGTLFDLENKSQEFIAQEWKAGKFGILDKLEEKSDEAKSDNSKIYNTAKEFLSRIDNCNTADEVIDIFVEMILSDYQGLLMYSWSSVYGRKVVYNFVPSFLDFSQTFQDFSNYANYGLDQSQFEQMLSNGIELQKIFYMSYQIQELLSSSNMKYEFCETVGRGTDKTVFEKLLDKLRITDLSCVVKYQSLLYFESLLNQYDFENEIEKFKDMLKCYTILKYEILLGDLNNSNDFYSYILIRALQTGAFSYSLSKKYYEQNKASFDEKKVFIDNLVEELKQAAINRLAKNTWLCKESRAKAQEKIMNMTKMIICPKRWDEQLLVEDSKAINISDDDNYATILDKLGIWYAKQNIRLVGATDEDDLFNCCLFIDTPMYEANGFYEPRNNNIFIPGGICDDILVDLSKPESFNYGTIGFVVAHEIIHSIDSNGANYDKNGLPIQWLNASDMLRYKDLQNKMIQLYDNIVYVNNPEEGTYYKVNGKNTLSENIADLGGLNILIDAYMAKLDKYGLSESEYNNRLKDLLWARSYVLCKSLSVTVEVRTFKDYDHSPSKARINGTLMNLDIWYDLYDVTPANINYLAPEDRIVIW